jgi:hypothetical protein
MERQTTGYWVQGGREFSREELALVREVVELFPGLSRKELARTLCDHLGWYAATGAPKVDACGKFLEKLEAQGLLVLPLKRRVPERAPVGARGRGEQTRAGPEVTGTLAEVGPVRLEVVRDRRGTEVWNDYVGRYHYLGYQRPFGCYVRYFVASQRGVLGCWLGAGAAKAIGARERWIGWSEGQRLRNLAWVVNNTRFLILPWIRVRHLASHVLGQVARQLPGDWEQRWGYRPVLLETFVDPAHYRGTCYRAAGWTCVGHTTGAGLRRPGRDYHTTPKRMYVQPLARDFRERLCSEVLQGRQVEP